MTNNKYLYNINYQIHEEALCKLEMRSVFKENYDHKTFISDIKMNPSNSPFLKSRLDISLEAKSFEELLELIKKKDIDDEGFKVVYMVYDENDKNYKNRKDFCKSVGLILKGYPNFKTPSIIFGITEYEGVWLFGQVIENNALWRNHNNRPITYSSSLGIHLAKSLINIASCNDFSKKIIDPCCGVGTILLEGAFAGYNIEGRELAAKVAKGAQKNLEFFNYDVKVTIGDINDIDENYDVSIIDLPYGICTTIDPTTQSNIIENASRISKKVVIVSTEDLTDVFNELKLTLIDNCQIQKNNKHNFSRYVWVCEKK